MPSAWRACLRDREEPAANDSRSSRNESMPARDEYGSCDPAFGTTEACASGSDRTASFHCRGFGGALRPRRGARGAEPPRKEHRLSAKRSARGAATSQNHTPGARRSAGGGAVLQQTSQRGARGRSCLATNQSAQPDQRIVAQRDPDLANRIQAAQRGANLALERAAPIPQPCQHMRDRVFRPN